MQAVMMTQASKLEARTIVNRRNILTTSTTAVLGVGLMSGTAFAQGQLQQAASPKSMKEPKNTSSRLHASRDDSKKRHHV
jgi:hypothetical protein